MIKLEDNEKPYGNYVDGALLDIDYVIPEENKAWIRFSVKGTDGKNYLFYDKKFVPYFYFIPDTKIGVEEIKKLKAQAGGQIKVPSRVEKETKALFGKPTAVFKVVTDIPTDVSAFADSFKKFGRCYEYDIPFGRRYLIDNNIIPLINYRFYLKDDDLVKVEPLEDKKSEVKLNYLCFDIETYNPHGMSRPEVDPVIMISYSYHSNDSDGNGVITTKKVNLPYVTYVEKEEQLFSEFENLLDKLDIDIVTGYNSATFDVRYMLDRAKALKIKFNMARYKDRETRIERYGLAEKVRIAGRVHVDTYLVVKFIAVVGAAEYILKLDNFKLKTVYDAVSGDTKHNVEKLDIWKLWDNGGEDLLELTKYNLSDSESLRKVYETFIPIMIELTRTTGNVLSDIAVSTTGQMVEFMLMRYAQEFGELIPNKPSSEDIRKRAMEPVVGAYVVTPEPGIYSNIAIFDFRGLYPSIIISHNIDPSSICDGSNENYCKDVYESPTGTKFSKTRKSIMPTILLILINQRAEVKKLYKLDKDNILLGSRSQALKIVSNSFYGYMGYIRSRWYSRECAGSVTAYGREYIHKLKDLAESKGFKVIYGDTDSIMFLLGNKTKDDAMKFLSDYNATLPEGMNLELEDFYTRGVFVGKKIQKGTTGAKKKYAMLSESGKIKIRGFELVRRDWSKVARDTQLKVLNEILKEGDAKKAVDIVRDVIAKIREGNMPIKEFAIITQLRKSIKNYTSKSPELVAAKKAIDQGLKTEDDLKDSVITYVITKDGASISDKASLLEFAKSYDPEYYINHQILPATLKILKELGYDEDYIKNLGTQKKL
ncbi:family B DNA polymerase [Candidatus Mancarchaeum acidiphilum]|uniref:DNA-directed DNA polymerase n=1 Tax=Candidatus Mancarchaeum acidiphilum TaxID=1920749 RepID=A0A218NMB6_9ARCH|nr:family B DNA polymerase [Candidatus Mancarchaeum acidiphilum]